MAAYTQTPPTSAERAAQRTQSNIKLVERDYYTLPYGLQLTVLADAARKQNGQVDANLLQQPLTDATMNVVLTDISAGQTADILARPLADFLTMPQAGQDVLHIEVLRAGEGEPYGSIRGRWGPSPRDPGVDPGALNGYTMQQFLEKMGDLHGTVLDHYVSYSVALSFAGRSVNYKAFYLFPAAEEDQVAQPIDMFLQATRYSQFPMAFRPDGILRSKWREIPAMHDWLASHTVPDNACSNAQMNSLCCVGTRCGLRQVDFERKMRWPLSGSTAPQAVTPLAEGGCNPNSYDTCACWPGPVCQGLEFPFSSTPNTACLIVGKYRQIFIAGLVPIGAYHTWIVGMMHLPGYTNAFEEFDGGPSSSLCPLSCGALNAYASPPPQGYEAGDVAGGGGFWSSGAGLWKLGYLWESL
jgi:hypothetical protein